MTKLSFQDFITQVGLREAEKMNTCHDDLGQFCSTGGSGMEESEINLSNPNIQKMIASSTATVFQKNPRIVLVSKNDSEVKVYIGAGDGQLRVKFGKGKDDMVENYASQTSAIDDALAFVDGAYNDRRYQRQVSILAEGENNEND